MRLAPLFWGGPGGWGKRRRVLALGMASPAGARPERKCFICISCKFALSGRLLELILDRLPGLAAFGSSYLIAYLAWPPAGVHT
ncbi:hypothetical protein SAMN05518855_101478 [Paenibacillus sp. CF384]|nr:hypothetical protein SAMN05518855_101478 [Paenibacillus sp. CF384]